VLLFAHRARRVGADAQRRRIAGRHAEAARQAAPSGAILELLPRSSHHPIVTLAS